MFPELLVNPALPRALAVGAFGGVGLVLTVVYSRRGPMIFVSYAALLQRSRCCYPGSGSCHTRPDLQQHSRPSPSLPYLCMWLLAYSASANASGFVAKGACRPSRRARGSRYGATYGALGLGSLLGAS